MNTPSMAECGEGYNVTKAQMIWIMNNYLPNEADRTHPLASPLLAADGNARPNSSYLLTIGWANAPIMHSHIPLKK